MKFLGRLGFVLALVFLASVGGVYAKGDSRGKCLLKEEVFGEATNEDLDQAIAQARLRAYQQLSITPVIVDYKFSVKRTRRKQQGRPSTIEVGTKLDLVEQASIRLGGGRVYEELSVQHFRDQDGNRYIAKVRVVACKDPRIYVYMLDGLHVNPVQNKRLSSFKKQAFLAGVPVVVTDRDPCGQIKDFVPGIDYFLVVRTEYSPDLSRSSNRDEGGASGCSPLWVGRVENIDDSVPILKSALREFWERRGIDLISVIVAPLGRGFEEGLSEILFAAQGLLPVLNVLEAQIGDGRLTMKLAVVNKVSPCDLAVLLKDKGFKLRYKECGHDSAKWLVDLRDLQGQEGDFIREGPATVGGTCPPGAGLYFVGFRRVPRGSGIESKVTEVVREAIEDAKENRLEELFNLFRDFEFSVGDRAVFFASSLSSGQLEVLVADPDGKKYSLGSWEVEGGGDLKTFAVVVNFTPPRGRHVVEVVFHPSQFSCVSREKFDLYVR